MGGAWPRACCHDLLRGAVGPADDAAAAWTRWRAADPEARCCAAAFPVIPRAYRRSSELGAVEAERARFEGVVRYAWASNAVAARAVAQALAELPVRPLLLKGAAVSRLLPEAEDFARSLGRIALLVKGAEGDAVLARLLELGWTTQPPLSRRNATANLAHRALGLAAPGSRAVRLELRSRASAQDPTAEGDAELRRDAQEQEFLGVRVMVPEARALFAHLLENGALESAVGDITWSVDAALLVASFAPKLDASWLASRASLRCTTLALWDSLRFLRDVLGCSSAAPLIAALERNPISPVELIAHQSLRPGSNPAPCKLVAQALVQERVTASGEKRALEPERALARVSAQPKLRRGVRYPPRRA